jgi:hypothetical protein
LKMAFDVTLEVKTPKELKGMFWIEEWSMWKHYE